VLRYLVVEDTAHNGNTNSTTKGGKRGGRRQLAYDYYSTVVCKKGQKVNEFNVHLAEVVSGVQSGKYKSSYAAAKALGLRPHTVLHRVRRPTS
jgi:hypothetical protein